MRGVLQEMLWRRPPAERPPESRRGITIAGSLKDATVTLREWTDLEGDLPSALLFVLSTSRTARERNMDAPVVK